MSRDRASQRFVRENPLRFHLHRTALTLPTVALPPNKKNKPYASKDVAQPLRHVQSLTSRRLQCAAVWPLPGEAASTEARRL